MTDTPQDARVDVPEGYARHTRHSPLTEPWEPLYTRSDGTSTLIALRVREAHCNSRGFAHGGLISALADNAMGLSAVMAARIASGQDSGRAVTVSLTLDFIASAQVGDWLEVRPTVLKAGRTMAFADCRIVVGERLVARGSATFHIG